MIKAYNITFKWSEGSNTFCANIVKADDIAKIIKHYEGHEIVSLTEASEYDLADAVRRGKPIITV